ncbi:hypothetical protein O7606_23250 [Micromonospora sp. WMMD882]|uniref:hypothetical protein n=1 Tax=Micromonospora sp. WMMD882 TaxID=3015151 RepID=UPI00248B2C85|nr:hypothetical protein [Micromonospora sp. WMMD882]WBB79071.1 hypothetical protein O7606_23250 [Micromonospora sp. WMMD882]
MVAGVAGVAATALAVTLAGAPGAQAAPATADAGTASVADRLVLEPTERGYRGALTAEVTNQSAETVWASYVITEPVPGSYRNDSWAADCYSPGDWLADGRVQVECIVPGSMLAPGERREFTVPFQVLTTVQPYAMKAGKGTLAVKVGGTLVTQESFRTRFRSPTGSLADPQPYVRDTRPDAAISVTGDLTVVRQPEGYFEGRLPVTVRYAGDAPHTSLEVRPVGMPAGFWDPWTECSHFCVPGGPMMEGEERTFDLVFGAASDITLGDLGTGGLEVRAWQMNPAPEADPSDNVATFSVRAVEAP